MTGRHRIEPGQESVWDYPRPPLVDPSTELVRVVLGGVVLAETTRAVRTLETSHPPTYYIPEADIAMERLRRRAETSWCEFKGSAVYWEAVPGASIGWSYPDPAPGYEALRHHLAFYPGRVDQATVDGEVVRAQAGAFYGGWITDRVVGPFKGEPGTRFW